jgi:hypothetical protein
MLRIDIPLSAIDLAILAQVQLHITTHKYVLLMAAIRV